MSFNENANRDALILQWEEAAKNLATAKEVEASLRAEVLKTAFVFSNDELREGTENVELGQGYKLKAVFKTSRNFAGGQEAVEKALQKIEKTGAEGEFIAERLVKWKPDLSVSEYKKLPEKFKRIIDEVLTAKPATPSLELVAPKSK